MSKQEIERLLRHWSTWLVDGDHAWPSGDSPLCRIGEPIGSGGGCRIPAFRRAVVPMGEVVHKVLARHMQQREMAYLLVLVYPCGYSVQYRADYVGISVQTLYKAKWKARSVIDKYY